MTDDIWKPYVPPPGARADDVEPLWTEPGHAPEMAVAYDDLVTLADGGALRFDRGFRNRLYTVHEGGWVSLTDLDDDFHSMRIALRITPEGLIERAAGRMLRNPYETCPRALESLAGLVGANLARPSAHKQLKERIPRTEGCLHVVDMLTVAFRGFRIAKGHDIEPSYEGEETRRKLLALLPQMRDTCLSFAVEHQGSRNPPG